jgi:hypothetical protein
MMEKVEIIIMENDEKNSRCDVVPAALIHLPVHQLDVGRRRGRLRLWLLRMMTSPLFVTRRRSSNGRSDEHDCLSNRFD